MPSRAEGGAQRASFSLRLEIPVTITIPVTIDARRSSWFVYLPVCLPSAMLGSCLAPPEVEQRLWRRRRRSSRRRLNKGVVLSATDETRCLGPRVGCCVHNFHHFAVHRAERRRRDSVCEPVSLRAEVGPVAPSPVVCSTKYESSAGGSPSSDSSNGGVAVVGSMSTERVDTSAAPVPFPVPSSAVVRARGDSREVVFVPRDAVHFARVRLQCDAREARVCHTRACGGRAPDEHRAVCRATDDEVALRAERGFHCRTSW